MSMKLTPQPRAHGHRSIPADEPGKGLQRGFNAGLFGAMETYKAQLLQRLVFYILWKCKCLLLVPKELCRQAVHNCIMTAGVWMQLTLCSKSPENPIPSQPTSLAIPGKTPSKPLYFSNWNAAMCECTSETNRKSYAIAISQKGYILYVHTYICMYICRVSQGREALKMAIIIPYFKLK